MRPAIGQRIAREWVRTTAGRLRRAHRAARGVRVAEFARAVTQRYAAAQVPWPALDLALRRPWPGVILNRISHRAQVYLAPHLTLTALRWSGQRRADGGSADWSAPEGLKPRVGPQIGIPLVRPFPVASFASTAVDRLVRRLAGRRERIESWRIPAASPIGGVSRTRNPGTDRERSRDARRGIEAPPRLPQEHAIPMVFRRPRATPTQSAATDPVPDNPRLLAHGWAWTADGARRPASPEPIDVNRLTDQVIQTIDRRIVAQRERMGRR
jgi:hypothetical protein